jgi:hypothetical protein
VSDEHYVVLGLAHVRAAWFSDVSRWSTAAALPVDFVKCVSGDELQARLRSGRAFSALLIDGALSALDRDLVDLCRAQGTPVVAVDSGQVQRDWDALDVSAVLLEPLDREVLLTTLRRHARSLPRFDAPVDLVEHQAPEGWRGRLVAVTGAGGTGTSTIAMAIAQHLASDARHARRIVLADLALDADQALLHDVGDVIPGVQELTDAHRGGTPSSDSVRALTFVDDARGYHLLLGLRRAREWSSLRPRAFTSAITSLLRTFTVTVADVDADVDGEEETGSADIEDRNLMSRTAMAHADLAVVTGSTSVCGVHALARTVSDLLAYGVEGPRILPVVNRAPRNPRQRAEIARALSELVAGAEGASFVPSPVFVAERRRLDDCIRDAVPFPRAFVASVGAAVSGALDHLDRRRPAEPQPIAAGSLGAWTDAG